MKILLINPPSFDKIGYSKGFRIMEVPLSLAYVAAALLRDGHEVKILDTNVLSSKAELKSAISSDTFEVIGFTATTQAIDNCFSIIRIVKSFQPGSKIVLGGWHASALPMETMHDCPLIDFIVKGEGEETMSELVRFIGGEHAFAYVKGILYRDPAGTVQETADRPLIQDIDKIPFPARHLLPLERYEHLGVSYLVYNVTPMDYENMERPLTSHLITSRGCYNRCTFCADHVIYKQKYRAHSPEYVLAEIKESISKFNIRIFNIIDPTFLVNQTRVEKICRLILNNGIKIRWCCQGRVDRPLPVDLLRLMKRAGCMKIYYGIESGSPRMIREMKKNLKIANIKKAISNTKEAGISNHVFFLYGFPSETLEDYYLTRQFIFELKPDNIEVHKVIPLPGTDLYARGVADGCLAGRNWKDFHYYFKEGIFYKEECLRPDARKIHAKFFSLSKQFNTSSHYIFTFIKRIKSIYYLKYLIKGIRVAIEYFAFLNPPVQVSKK